MTPRSSAFSPFVPPTKCGACLESMASMTAFMVIALERDGTASGSIGPS